MEIAYVGKNGKLFFYFPNIFLSNVFLDALQLHFCVSDLLISTIIQVWDSKLCYVMPHSHLHRLCLQRPADEYFGQNLLGTGAIGQAPPRRLPNFYMLGGFQGLIRHFLCRGIIFQASGNFYRESVWKRHLQAISRCPVDALQIPCTCPSDFYRKNSLIFLERHLHATHRCPVDNWLVPVQEKKNIHRGICGASVGHLQGIWGWLANVWWMPGRFFSN